ncbi:serine protease 30-like [Trichoplusia ni]|uniref:Serine protease 30-like n=1 Tax=Trichoplusia ni TaxID=7111 RepID=A0A7E5WKB2_TRINI|nr:serine protease 30-like [Trichoplusia ni]
MNLSHNSYYQIIFFRSLARVVLGSNCSGSYIKVKDYTFHPDFDSNSFNTLAIIQLDTFMMKQIFRPICPPPKSMTSSQIYAMSLTQDCSSDMVMVYKMEYVKQDECQHFYRRTGLDMASLWPTHYACARATSGEDCIWRSGTVLVTRQRNRWQLLGIGVYGPGCNAPARFMDYGIYSKWVTDSLARIGRPAVTRLAPNHLVIRRS